MFNDEVGKSSKIISLFQAFVNNFHVLYIINIELFILIIINNNKKIF